MDRPEKKNAPETKAAAEKPPAVIKIGKGGRTFDIENPKLPGWLDKHLMRTGGYPYDKKLKSEKYEARLEQLQIELVKLLAWTQATGARVITLFEGRDAAGKGGAIAALREHANPRTARNVALPKPTEVERGQWYFQRYVQHFPTAGEFVTFDRSWYNRAGVEPVMGFCTPEQHQQFLDEAPKFEGMIVRDGIYFFKFWLSISREVQMKRFHDRRHSPLTSWKFSPIDIAGMGKWDAYSRAIDLMLQRTHSAEAPWTVIRANDKRRARLAVLQRILQALPYTGRDLDAVGTADPLIVGEGPLYLKEE